ncbi:hypothetical protein FGO68_gene6564 [Halteria grandinella]|uniref:Uncharacterized protein n=1 Tax=Halteria grandinella TaxID=5974 RepID=A0A8J8NWM1_HALGN|nr:hypothetical protein FGO68_gene6564 [Halteria grandinella]
MIKQSIMGFKQKPTGPIGTQNVVLFGFSRAEGMRFRRPSKRMSTTAEKIFQLMQIMGIRHYNYEGN